ncbi:phosphopantetheine-binding protein [Streptomyces sp. NPDC014861]|uniref:phosphopantetheine-binding protein n=1 Tax=Streptomyces sp. NPDC014861 TaxID=3364923 RepID=UPI003700B186
MSAPERALPSDTRASGTLPSEAPPSRALPSDESASAERAAGEWPSDTPPDTVLSHAAQALRPQVAALVSRSTDGTVGVRELLDSTEPLAALGVSSLSLLRLVDAVEETYGVFVDLGDRTLHTEGLRGLTERLVRLGAEATP